MFIRRSIRDLENEYNKGTNKKPLEDLIRALKGIQELPTDDPNSFFVIGGYHGEPFRGAGWGNPPVGVGFATMVTFSSLHGTAPILLGCRMLSVQFEAARKSHFPTGMR
jgi:hypothetical protein